MRALPSGLESAMREFITKQSGKFRRGTEDTDILNQNSGENTMFWRELGLTAGAFLLYLSLTNLCNFAAHCSSAYTILLGVAWYHLRLGTG